MVNDKVVEQVDAELKLAVELVRKNLADSGLLLNTSPSRMTDASIVALVRRVYAQLMYSANQQVDQYAVRIDQLVQERNQLQLRRVDIARDHNFLCDLTWWTDETKWPLPLQQIAEKYNYPLPDRARTETLKKNVLAWLSRDVEAIDQKVTVLNSEIARLQKL